jgi:hypothetical protein
MSITSMKLLFHSNLVVSQREISPVALPFRTLNVTVHRGIDQDLENNNRVLFSTRPFPYSGTQIGELISRQPSRLTCMVAY